MPLDLHHDCNRCSDDRETDEYGEYRVHSEAWTLEAPDLVHVDDECETEADVHFIEELNGTAVKEARFLLHCIGVQASALDYDGHQGEQGLEGDRGEDEDWY